VKANVDENVEMQNILNEGLKAYLRRTLVIGCK